MGDSGVKGSVEVGSASLVLAGLLGISILNKTDRVLISEFHHFLFNILIVVA